MKVDLSYKYYTKLLLFKTCEINEKLKISFSEIYQIYAKILRFFKKIPIWNIFVAITEEGKIIN